MLTSPSRPLEGDPDGELPPQADTEAPGLGTIPEPTAGAAALYLARAASRRGLSGEASSGGPGTRCSRPLTTS
jgi:hypothetical protein